MIGHRSAWNGGFFSMDLVIIDCMNFQPGSTALWPWSALNRTLPKNAVGMKRKEGGKSSNTRLICVDRHLF